MQDSRSTAVFLLLALTAAGFLVVGVLASTTTSPPVKSLYFTEVDESWARLNTSSSVGAVVRISFSIAPQQRNSGRVFYAVEEGVPPAHAAIIGVQLDPRLRKAELIVSAPRQNIHKTFSLEMPPSAEWYHFSLFYNFTSNNDGNISFGADRSPVNVSVSAEGVSHLLRGSGDFYLGGLPSSYFRISNDVRMKSMRNHLIAGAPSFEGCMYSPEIHYSSGHVERPEVMEGQHWLANACGEVGNECSLLDPASCGAGACTEDHDGIWRCDCRKTEQAGKDCSLKAAVVRFYGNQGFIVKHTAAPPLSFDISLYFKSALPSGMIVYLVDLSNRSKVAVYIEEGLLVMKVHLAVNQSEVEYTVAPDWPVEAETWYFVHVTGRRNNVTMQLGTHMISAVIPLPKSLFGDNAEVTLGDTDTASAPQAFKGCMNNIHFGIQKPADVSIIAVDVCPDTEDPPVSPPPKELVFVTDPNLGHRFELESVYHKVNVTFNLHGRNTTGNIVDGWYYNSIAFSLSLYNGFPILQWHTLFDEQLILFAASVDIKYLCTFTVLMNESHVGLVVEQWGQRSADFRTRAPGIIEVNSISFGGTRQSLPGVIYDLRVNGYNPTVWTTVHPEDSGTDASVSLPTPQPSSSAAVSNLPTPMVMNVATATSTPSSKNNDRVSSMVLGNIESSTELGDRRTLQTTLAGSATAPMHVHQTSSPTATNSVDMPLGSLADKRDIALGMLAATIFIATLVVVIAVLASVFMMLHCWQTHRLTKTANGHQNPETGDGKESPTLKKQ